MDRFQPLDVSNSTLGAHLYNSEEVYLLTAGVGLYSGPQKSLPHASGTVYLTSHRLFYIDDLEPHRHSCFVKLSLIRETEFYAGFLKSSPKVTLGLKPRDDENKEGAPNGQRSGGTNADRNRRPSSSSKTSAPPLAPEPTTQDWRLTATASDPSAARLPTSSWVCRVCAFSNAFDPGTDVNSSVRCSLCGVTTEVKDLKLQQQQTTAAEPKPNGTTSKVDSSTAPKANGPKSDGIACGVCTFSNHPSMLRCEICDSPLGTVNVEEASLLQRHQLSATPASGRSQTSLHRTATKTPEPADDEPPQRTYDHVRLSFRKGGDRPFYDTLKITLKEKRWQRLGEQREEDAAIRTNAARKNDLTARNRVRNSLRYVGGGSASNIDGRSAAAAESDDENADGQRSSRRVGIEGILSAVDLQKREESSDMKDALQDLEALMARAKKMVDFAESLNSKLTRQEAQRAAGGGTETAANVNQEAASLIRTSMLQLGLPTPAITADMARDEVEYNTQLARELGGLLYAERRPLIGRGKILATARSADQQRQQSLSSPGDRSERKGTAEHVGRGILALDEVWCMWNRARGIALVSPKELLAVLPFLARLTEPTISMKTFSSGLKVLHTPRYNEANLCTRIRTLLLSLLRPASDMDEGRPLDRLNGLSTLELAQRESCPVSLMDELLNEIELNAGAIVRDEHAGQVRWYLNPFTDDIQGVLGVK